MFRRLDRFLGCLAVATVSFLGPERLALADFANVVTSCGAIDYSGSVGLSVTLTVDTLGNLCGVSSGGTSGSFGNNADASVPIATGLAGNKVFNYGYDPTGVSWDRMTINPNNASGTLLTAGTSNSMLVTGMLAARNTVATGIAIATMSGIPSGDATGAISTSIAVSNFATLFNGANWDRARSNVDSAASILTLAAQAPGTVTSADQTNFNGRGVKLGINVTADSAGTALVVVTIQGKDIVSGQYYTILSSASIAAVGFSTLQVYPGITATANVAANDILPRTWRVSITVSGAGTASATVGSSNIL